MSNPNELSTQYRQALSAGGYFPRGHRGLIEVTGADRAAWLSNLVTNVVKTLQPGEGNYSFALNVKGRTLFDLNILVLEDRLLLDVDRRWCEAALKHFDRYTITEDVKLKDVTDQFGRMVIAGSSAQQVVQRLGLGNLLPMAQLQHVSAEMSGHAVRLVRHDLTGMPGAEVFYPSEAGIGEIVARECQNAGMCELGAAAVEVLRIEAGIPASVDDIDEEVVPPETGQIERGISYHKGCYLGQEVIERMRSHGILARKLVGLCIQARADDAARAVAAQLSAGEGLSAGVIKKGSLIRHDEKDVGRVTSGCFSETLQAPLLLGYVKSMHAAPGVNLAIETAAGRVMGTIVPLPVSRKAVESA